MLTKRIRVGSRRAPRHQATLLWLRKMMETYRRDSRLSPFGDSFIEVILGGAPVPTLASVDEGHEEARSAFIRHRLRALLAEQALTCLLSKY